MLHRCGLRSWARNGGLMSWLAALCFGWPAYGSAETPADVLKQEQVSGGLVVLIGCQSPDEIAALRLHDGLRVLALDADQAAVNAARRTIQAAGDYGQVSADRFDGRHLPLIDNVVNVLIVHQVHQLDREEMLRVLVPEGTLVVRSGDTWQRSVKARPDEIDVWTHFLHNPSNNAVARDTVVDMPRRLQWTAGPRYSRHHDHMASVSAMVSNGPQVFSIVDMGSRWSIFLPADWQLVARDAFNGTLLWSKPMGRWFTHHYALKSGPGDLPRRLVAVGKDVFFTPAIDAPLERVDAATGHTRQRYEQTAATEEILFDDGVLFLKVNRPDNQLEFESVQAARRLDGGVRFNLDPRRILAVDADSGATLWQRESVVMPTTLAVDEQRVYFHDGQSVVCLDRSNGDELWKQPVSRWSVMQTFFTPTLVVHDGVVLFAGGEKMVPHRGGQDSMTAMRAETGEVLWTAYHPQGGYMSAEDLLVVGGLVWAGETTGGNYSGVFTGRDVQTGEVKNEFGPDVDTYWFHHRCYRGKATDRFLLMSRTGIEFLDLDQQSWDIHHWVRGGCLYGIMPCNGLIYAPPSNCACYPEVKLFGFNALAPAPADGHAIQVTEEALRLEAGPAYGQLAGAAEAHVGRADWPTYRGDNGRSGATDSEGPSTMRPKWQVDLQTRLTPPVIAAGRVLTAAVDRHTVHALCEQTGELLWSFTAGGRIDSPPTVHQGGVYFGSADGWVYCLRAEDGQLAWRYLAAFCDRRMVAYEQVESIWPLRGSVLIEDGRLYTVAGRSVFLDGGLRLVILDPTTGRLLGEQHFDDIDPETGDNLQVRTKVLNLPVGLNDILSSDGNHIYLKSQVLDKEGNRGDLGPHSGDPAGQGSVQRGDTAHLFAPFDGFIDGDWFHRSYWVFGRSFAGGHAGYHQAGRYAPSGRILVFDHENVYGFGRKPEFYRWTTPLEHQLFCADRVPLQPPLDRRGEPSKVVQVANTPALDPTGKPLAVEAWVKVDRPNGVVVARGGPANGFALVVQGGVPQFMIRSQNDLFSVAASGRKVLNQWHHLAGVLTADKRLKIFVDGRLMGTEKVPRLIAAEPLQTMEIGSDEDSSVGDYRSPFPLGGWIDDVKVYFGEVTDDEIARHAAEGPEDTQTAQAELVFHATFDDGTASDMSGKAHHGNVVGIAAVEGKFGKALRFEATRRAAEARFFVEHKWNRDLPILVRAMTKAGDRLFVAGPPDLLDEDAAFTARLTPHWEAQFQAQDDANRGARGALLLAVSASSGQILAEYAMADLPLWDGLAAANGQLFLATENGKLLCLGD